MVRKAARRSLCGAALEHAQPCGWEWTGKIAKGAEEKIKKENRLMDLFPERLKELKNAKQLTYRQIADSLGLQLRTVQYYAAGKLKPDYYGLIKIAELFDVSLDYLVGRSDSEMRM